MPEGPFGLWGTMYDEAFHVLSSIKRGEAVTRNPTQERWLHAFAAIKWTEVTDEGVALTPEGLAALNDMRASRRQVAPRRREAST